ncbi:helix-turn-helix transcriptional regulator [Loigolactobacillus binensis]|uniref:Helix-turn-helix transcriptional regulator n=1 Tax=Loigolactobacillus binensis TaxID=2559922 RepID=A0ABW3EAL2_9LACO|nr:helix-turn-helix transcriptional regulator [Loigolactobacillus binensis]
MNLGKTVAQRMREIRIEKGLSQTYVAEKLGFKSSQRYANIEYGHAKLSLEIALRVADIFEVDINDFLREKVKHFD